MTRSSSRKAVTRWMARLAIPPPVNTSATHFFASAFHRVRRWTRTRGVVLRILAAICPAWKSHRIAKVRENKRNLLHETAPSCQTYLSSTSKPIEQWVAEQPCRDRGQRSNTFRLPHHVTKLHTSAHRGEALPYMNATVGRRECSSKNAKQPHGRPSVQQPKLGRQRSKGPPAPPTPGVLQVLLRTATLATPQRSGQRNTTSEQDIG
eukprot:scaffold1328_cov394-Prasinococcus_capsulatus_cf.AAC.3